MKRASAIKLLLGTTILLSLILTSPFVRLPFHVFFYGEDIDFRDIAISYVSKMIAIDLSGELVDHVYSPPGWRGDQDVSAIIQLSAESMNALLNSDHISWLVSPFDSVLSNKSERLFLNTSANHIDKEIYRLLNEPDYLYMYRDDYAIINNTNETYFDRVDGFPKINTTTDSPEAPYIIDLTLGDWGPPPVVDITVCLLDPTTNTLYYREWDS